MTTPNTIISRLRNDFDCRLTTAQLISIINNLEKRLAIDVVEKRGIIELDVMAGKTVYTLDFPAKYIFGVAVNGQQIKKKSLLNPLGYSCQDNELIFAKAFTTGKIQLDCLIIPKDITESELNSRALFLEEGHDEIYIYHILSREALMSSDITALNNFSLLYAEALKLLKAEVFKEKNILDKYHNVW